jgi:O-Antigen ligase
MNGAIIGIAIAGFVFFLTLQPKVKALIAFFLMMQFMDVAPNILFGMYVWDYGAILMLITGVEVFLRKPVMPPAKHAYMSVLWVLLAWLAICFAWSLVIYRYPIGHTIKSARYMVLGYYMTPIFVRLFSVQPDAFEFLMKWLYRLTLALMPVILLQYVLQRPLLSGLVRDYEGVLRAVPIFLPLCTLNMWIIAAKSLSGEKLKVHESIYLLLAVTTTALTFTRGIYIGVLLTGGLLVWLMSRDRTLKATAVLNVSAVLILLTGLLFATGVAQKVGERALSGLHLISSGDSIDRHQKDDTFSGRLGLAEERFSMAWSQNPLVGYGFIHEDDVPSSVRSSLKYGTVLGGTAADPEAYSRTYEFTSHFVLGFYTSDIAWADIVVATGCVGVLLIIALVLTFVFEHLLTRGAEHPMGYAVRTGLFLQVVTMFMLTFDGNDFYGAVHILALLFAGYSLTRPRQVVASSSLPPLPTRPANLLR